MTNKTTKKNIKKEPKQQVLAMPNPASFKSKLVKMRADELTPHPTAQRSIIEKHLAYLINNLDLDAVGAIHVVQYAINGVTKFWIVDGQHRWKALMHHGFGEWIVNVELHVDVKDNRRASALFNLLNKKATVGPYPTFVNDLQAFNPQAVGIDNITKQHGIKISTAVQDGNIVCISALRKVYAIDDGDTLSNTFDVLLSSYGTTAAAVESKLVEGLGLVLAKYNGALDKPALIKKLAKYPGGASGLLGDARGLRDFRKTSLPRCVAERVIEHYNMGRRASKLDPL